MPWNGSGSTLSANAVLASASFDQPSTSNRKSRFQPGGTGRQAARVEAQLQFVAGAHDDEAVVRVADQLADVAVARVEARAPGSTSPGAPSARSRTTRAARARGSSTAFEKPRSRRPAVSASIAVIRTGGGSGLLAQEDLVPEQANVGDDADLARGG